MIGEGESPALGCRDSADLLNFEHEATTLQSIKRELESRVCSALTATYGNDAQGVEAAIKATSDPKFGDYQANFAMGLAKKLGKKPRDVASEVQQNLPVSDLCEAPEIAGPGFINFTI